MFGAWLARIGNYKQTLVGLMTPHNAQLRITTLELARAICGFCTLSLGVYSQRISSWLMQRCWSSHAQNVSWENLTVFSTMHCDRLGQHEVANLEDLETRAETSWRTHAYGMGPRRLQFGYVSSHLLSSLHHAWTICLLAASVLCSFLFGWMASLLCMQLRPLP